MTPEEEELEWDKEVGQFTGAIRIIMQPLTLYGQKDYVASVVQEIVSLAIQLHHKLSGLDIPYHVNHEKLHY